ncbi:MAG: SLBB domain-containing protein [Candidatus Hydrogenedentota bacterium]
MRVRILGTGAAVMAFVIVLSGTAWAGDKPVVKREIKKHPAIEEAVTVPTEDLRPEGEPAPEATTKELGPPRQQFGGDYHIGAGDSLLFQSFDDEALSSDVVVRYDGFISLPLIPDVNVLDKTRAEATDLLRKAYEEVFIDPQISLSIRQVTSKSYFVMGSVTRPSEYPYSRPINLLDAINIAGGKRINTRGGDSFVGASGQLVKALVIRETAAGREVGDFDLRGLDKPGNHPAMSPVYPGDIVYVPEGLNLVYVLGEVRQPGVRELTENMTMLQVLTQAGGATEQTGKIRQVVLLREQDDENTEVMTVNVRAMLKSGGDFPLEAGDVIYVPQRTLVRVQNFVQQFTGPITSVMGLYRQAYDTYYTDTRYRQLYGNNGSAIGGGQDLAAIAQLLQDLQGFVPITTK